MEQTVVELERKEALKYFMEAENYCTLPLPSYFDFQKMLNYVKNKVRNRTFDNSLKDKKKKPSDMEGVNYKFLITKDGKYSFRPIQIANPYLYYLLVRTITEETNWKKIQDRFNKFKNEKIEVSSIPHVKNEKDKSEIATQIHNWWMNLEQRSIALSLEYKYMFVTDITNCYGSVYTHTIDWAIEDKNVSKDNNLNNRNSLGHTIDTYISAMQYGQTNGLPQGSVLFDFVAEIILGYADMQLWKWAQEKGIERYKILRYRDDYRIFGNEKETVEQIVMQLQRILADLNFRLNDSKTLLTEEIVEHAIKRDKLAYMQYAPIYKIVHLAEKDKIESLLDSYQKELYYILQFSKQYPDSASLRRLLQLFLMRIMDEEKKAVYDPDILIAICVEIGYANPRYCNNVIAIISHLIKKIDITARNAIIRSVRAKLERLPNIGMIQIWLQRMTYHLDIDDLDCPYKECMCQLVMESRAVKLWNFEWLLDALYEDFPYDTLINQKELDSMTPEIMPEEIDCFYYDDMPENK